VTNPSRIDPNVRESNGFHRLERLDDEAERPDPGIPSLPVHEKRKHAYSNALTRVVADRKGDMAMFDSAANSERCVLEHADIQIFSPEQLEPGAFIQVDTYAASYSSLGDAESSLGDAKSSLG
jgi:hypothetical protein